MTALTRRSLSVPHGIGKIPAYLVRPRAPGTYPCVVVIMEWWGLNEHFKDVADRFAAEGFAAIAPDLYHGKIAGTPEDAAAYYGAMSMEGAVRECISCSDYLRAQPWSNGKTSMVGYCLGGTVCYLAPCRGANVDATVAFYGNAPDPGGQLKHAECPIFGIFGAAVAAAKVMRLTEDELTNAIGLCVNLAGGNLESRGLRESAAARNAMLAVALARQGRQAGEAALEGDAGFYHAYAGNNRGDLTYSFVGDTRTSLDALTAGLGEEWLFLETLYRIYSTAGYNIAHVDVTAQLCEEHDIRYEDVDRVEAVVNWLETQYPSPAFPVRREDLGEATVGSTRYHTAYGVVRRGLPVLPGAPDPPEVLDLMTRVTIIPSHEMTLFGPRITIFTKDGRSYTKQATGREFIWDFDEEVRRIGDVVPGIPISAAQFEEIVATCRDLDRADRADRLVRLTVP